MRVLLFIALLSTVSFGCRDNDPEDNNGSSSSEFFAYTYNGEQVRHTGVNAYALKDFDDDGSTNIYGVNNSSGADFRQVLIRVEDDAALGVAQTFDAEMFFAFVNDDTDSYSTLPVIGGTGSVTITKRSTSEIAGTFQFTAFNTTDDGTEFTVTEGSFDVNYD